MNHAAGKKQCSAGQQQELNAREGRINDRNELPARAEIALMPLVHQHFRLMMKAGLMGTKQAGYAVPDQLLARNWPKLLHGTSADKTLPLDIAHIARKSQYSKRQHLVHTKAAAKH